MVGNDSGKKKKKSIVLDLLWLLREIRIVVVWLLHIKCGFFFLQIAPHFGSRISVISVPWGYRF